MSGDVERIIERERTKRAWLRTTRLAVTLGLAVFGAVASIAKPEVAGPIMIVVVVTVLSSLIIEYVNREDSDG